jgi:hypothetical protein
MAGAGDAGLADADRVVKDHGLPGMEPAPRGQIFRLRATAGVSETSGACAQIGGSVRVCPSYATYVT